MSNQVKVSPLAQEISSAPVTQLATDNVLTLSQSSNVALNLSPETVQGYSKSGADLLIKLQSGETIRIVNFYAEGQAPSQLFLVEDDRLVAVSLPPVAADGALAAQYIPQQTLAGFESLTSGGEEGITAGMAWLIGAGVVGGGAAIASAVGDDDGGNDAGNGSETIGGEVDVSAPAPASNLQVAPDGSSVSGKAEPGATVGVDNNGDGVPDQTVVVGADGSFTAPLQPPLTNGETISVVVTDPAGNSSPPAQVAAPDTTAPAPASNLQVAPDGSSVSGTAEPGATVLIDHNGDGTADASAVVAANGSFTVPLTPPLHDAETISVVVRDPAGNSSSPVTIVAPDFPSAPLVNPSNGHLVSGTAEAGVDIEVRDPNGNLVGQVTADGTGVWSIIPALPVADGVTLNVQAVDGNGNHSPTVSVLVDAIAPLAPVIAPSNGVVITGTAEAGAIIDLTNAGGTVLGQVTAGSNGQWSFTPATPLPNGVQVNVIASDVAGNHSPVSSVTVDTLPPPIPTVDLSNGSSLSGTAEAGSTVLISNASGSPIGQVQADAGGAWSFTPSTPLGNGTQVKVAAKDAAGNTSPQASVTIDAIAPAIPTINPCNGKIISGTGEAGALITLTDSSGNVLGTASVVGGVWTYDLSPDLAHGDVVIAKASDPTGNISGAVAITVDAQAPNAPIIAPSNGLTINGTAEAGAHITIKDALGAVLGSADADGSGNWSFIPSTLLNDGAVVSAQAQDAAGNPSAVSTVTVDKTPPPTPTVGLSDGSSLSGTAEAGSTVLISNASGSPIGQVQAGPGGTWSFTPSAPLGNGTQVKVAAKDAAGNTSLQASVTIDSVAPAAPVINPCNGKIISGTGETGALITLTDSSGNVLGTASVVGGVWTYDLSPDLAHGDVVTAKASDPTGNISGAATITVDTQAPDAPNIAPSNGLTISGTAEAWAHITIKDALGAVLGSADADGSGNWSFIPSTLLNDGAVVSVQAQDAAGNPSAVSTVTVDKTPPPTPTVGLSNGSSLSGTAEAGSTVLISNASGSPIGQVQAGPGGTWSFTPSTPLDNGTQVKVAAKDAAGNTSLQASVTIDSVAPAAPVINPSNGKTISGTGETGALITLTDSSGNALGTTTVVAGVWSHDLNPDLAHGAVVIAKASDPTGNISVAAATTVDAQAPNAPIIAPSNGQTITGTAEAWAHIIIKDALGVVLGSTDADGSGHWIFSPVTAFDDTDVVKVQAQDAALNLSPESSVTVDAAAPPAPLVNASNGSVLSGTAEGNATIDIYVGGISIGQTKADAGGNWTFVPTSPLFDDTVVTVTATDAAQNISAPGGVTIDTSLPSTPLINPTNGVIITGTADVGDTVELRDASGTPLIQVSVGVDGKWTYTPPSPWTNGTVIKAVAINTALTASAEVSTVVDTVAPDAPVVAPSNGEQISGTAEAGATITLTDSVLGLLGQVTADASGHWTFIPSTALNDGALVTVRASDAANNISSPANVTVDASPPGLPSIAPSNGVTVKGTAEANATVLIRNGSGALLGQTQADASGNWSFAPSPALADGSVIKVVAKDAAGNISVEATATVDAVAPPTPLLNLSNGTLISGTAEAGSTVLLTNGSGAVIGQASVNGSGDWAFNPLPALLHGVVINARAQDAAGNTSAAATTSVDTVAPPTPVVLLSNGSVLTGTAEAGVKLIISNAATGATIVELTVPANGTWSYTPGTALAHGMVVNVKAQDAVGNSSANASVTVDSVAPLAPTVALSNGSSLSGTAEANSRVIITDGSGNPIGQTTASATGTWSFNPATALAHGVLVNVVARDATGNTSPSATVTIDSQAPAAPTINPSNGQVFNGTAEAGAIVTLTGSGGIVLGQVPVGPGGLWSFTPGSALANGTLVSATARDATGNTSTAAAVTVDAQAPDAPSIALSNGAIVQGTAEAGAKVVLTDGSGNLLAEVMTNASGTWSYTPTTALGHGTVVNARAVDAVANTSSNASVTIDAQAPNAPLIRPTNGALLSGTGEVGAVIKLTDGTNAVIGQTTVGAGGNWSFTPTTPLAHGTVVKATATDATGNVSAPSTISVDKVAPNAPVLVLNHDGNLLTGTAEANSQVRIVLNGDNANPRLVSVNASGNFSLPISPALVAGEAILGVAIDASGNISLPTTIHALDLAPPTLAVAEAADGYINAVEASNGIQVQVGLRPTMQAGQVLTLKFAGQNGYQQDLSHTLTSSDINAGSVNLTLAPQGANGPFPQGASSISATVSGGSSSAPVNFVVDTIAPNQPILSLVGNLLSVTSDPFTKVLVAVTVGGVVAKVEVVTDVNGKALVDLLSDLDIDLNWDQLLTAQVSARAEDLAGNQGNIASIGVGPSVPQPITVGNFGLDIGLLPPKLGISGVTTPGATVRVEIDTPVLDTTLNPVVNSSTGAFSVNLLGLLSISDILNLGPDLSIMVVTSNNGVDSSRYGIDLLPAGGGLLQLGTIHLYGTSGSDFLTGRDGSAELIHGYDGNDLIRNVGTSDRVEAGEGNDTIQLTAVNFTRVDGGAGFDTLLLAGGIDLDYNAIGVGTLANIERINLGKGDSGSDLTLTAAEVGIITDSNNTLQITGESNDKLKVAGATDTHTSQVIGGVSYDVYSFGANTLLVEDNTVQVVLV